MLINKILEILGQSDDAPVFHQFLNSIESEIEVVDKSSGKRFFKFLDLGFELIFDSNARKFDYAVLSFSKETAGNMKPFAGHLMNEINKSDRRIEVRNKLGKKPSRSERTEPNDALLKEYWTDMYHLEFCSVIFEFDIETNCISAVFLFGPNVSSQDNEAEELLGLLLNQLTDDDVSAIESSLARDPMQIQMQVTLLAHYFGNHIGSDANTASWIKQIVWLIDNRPDHPALGMPYATVDPDTIGYSDLRTRWTLQIEARKDNPFVLGNAASFFRSHDFKFAENLLKTAKSIQPNNPMWSIQLANLYALHFPDHVHEALAESEHYLELAGPQDSWWTLIQLPKRAFEAGEFEKASRAASKLLDLAERLQSRSDYGDAVQSAHTVLGRIALRQGDLETAKVHLHKSALNGASPVTRSFGPEVTLAKELMDRGEINAVLDYVDQCKSFCGPFHERVLELRIPIVIGSIREIPSNELDQLNLVQALHKLYLQELEKEPAIRLRESILKCVRINEEVLAFMVGDTEVSRFNLSSHWSPNVIEYQRQFLAQLMDMIKVT